MKRISLMMGVVAVLAATSFVSVSSQRPRTGATRTITDPQVSLQRAVTAQQRINRYFQSSVIPKLKNCWSGVQGRGTIQIEHNYTRDAGGKWVAGKLTVGKSTLPSGQTAVALQCMQSTVRGSSFSIAPSDGDSQEYVVKWTWPVPFPADIDDQMRVMFAAKGGGSGSGCDGKGTPAACWDCEYQRDGIPKCKQRCEGYKECYYGPQDSCQVVYRCTTGGLTGVAGEGTIMY